MRRRSADFRQYHKRCTRFTQTLHKGAPFFAEPQRGVALCGARETAAPAAGATPYPRRGGFAVCGRRDVAVPTAGAKRKDNLRFSFLFELLPFPCFLIWRRLPTCDRFENRERQSGYLSVSFSAFSQFTDSVLLHIWATPRRARHSSAAQFDSAL